MLSAVFVAAGLLSTGVSSEEGTWSPDRLIDASKALFDERLVDYPSARFKDVRMSEDATFLCGSVNSRSRAGGYAGWHRFAVKVDGPSPRLAMINDDIVAPAMARECSGDERTWSPTDFSKAVTFSDEQ
ncbi:MULTISPECIES: hypothetical protein [unclassified Brevundimonas]|uniref:hypothetical protein n=1 Tax=unclassified Brevundimonas TaxID=2622653 RepID=UPI0025BB83F6|nr:MULTISPECIES: hypothetical protein [unclassified Brevundimonas]